MSEQNQALEAISARVPKRERGRQRVEALLDAAAAVFFEQGVEATTMTAIAARAGASIGSLYQFFPSKVLLASALRERFSAHVEAALAALAADENMTHPEVLADGLLALMLSLREERALAILLVDPRDEQNPHRVAVRSMMRERLAALLRRANPAFDEVAAATRAVLVLHMLKLIHQLPLETHADGIATDLRGWLVSAIARAAPDAA